VRQYKSLTNFDKGKILYFARNRTTLRKNVEHSQENAGELAHSGALSRVTQRKAFREVLERGGPPPLLERCSAAKEFNKN